MRDIFQEITDRIAAQIEQGVRPWSKPWSDKRSVAIDLPHNIAGRPYRGANVFWLWCAQEARGYPTACWLTFKQAQAAGGTVRAGEKGTLVFFWKIGKVEDKATGEERKTFMHRTYTVFNVAQCDGIEAPAKPEPLPEPERIAAAESIMAATGALIVHGGNQAFYMPALDRVQLPERDQFVSADGYYSTAFHELGHWTGHESRCKREFGKRFGDQAYAFEELIAELTSAFVCASQGFASIDRPDHASYLANWLKIFKGDAKAFIKAASEAQKAADLILGRSFEAAESEPVESVAAVAQAA